MYMRLIQLFKSGYGFIVLGIIFLGSSLIPWYVLLPASGYWEIRQGLSNNEQASVYVGYFIGGSFAYVDISVTGGDSKVTAYLTDSSDNVLKQGVVDSSGTFPIGVGKSDFYALKLQNDDKWFVQNDKQVLVKVYYYLYSNLLQVSGAILLVLGVVLAVYDYYRRGKGTEKAQIHT